MKINHLTFGEKYGIIQVLLEKKLQGERECSPQYPLLLHQETTMRTCKKCKEVKPLTDFSKTKKNSIYRKHTCKSCRNKAINRRRRFALYGTTEEWYEDKLVKQDYRCAGCHTHQKDLEYTLSVDHCHETGKLRGLLCKTCNSAIARLGDTYETVRKAAEYLKERG